MSIFVSKSIEDIINLDSLTKGEELRAHQYGVVFADLDKNVFIDIKFLEKITETLYSIEFSVNLNLFEKLFFKKLEADKIIIGSSTLKIRDYHFEKSSCDGDTHSVFLKMYTSEDSNVQHQQ